jgi:ABC-type glycerol-3-phosphate transport system substrate-binding protein
MLICMIKCFVCFAVVTVVFTEVSTLAEQKAVTIAVVNDADMIPLQKLSPKFEERNPDIKLNWMIVEENVLRQRVTTDVSTGSDQFEIVFALDHPTSRSLNYGTSFER